MMTKSRRFTALIFICLAELLVVLDNTVVNVALPTMSVDLFASVSDLQWIVDAYTLTFAGFLLTFGHLGDRFGRRRVMIIGLIGVGAMSLVGALASNLEQVIMARAAMGVFAAAVFPATLAMITNIFTDARERAIAIAAWTAMAGFAIAIGPTAGGWLLEHFSWHSVFWMNVPGCVAGHRRCAAGCSGIEGASRRPIRFRRNNLVAPRHRHSGVDHHRRTTSRMGVGHSASRDTSLRQCCWRHSSHGNCAPTRRS